MGAVELKVCQTAVISIEIDQRRLAAIFVAGSKHLTDKQRVRSGIMLCQNAAIEESQCLLQQG